MRELPETSAPRLRQLAVMDDGSCEASFEDGTALALGPTASTFELSSPAAGRVRQLTSCCVSAYAPWVREVLAYRNRLVDTPVLHAHLLTAEQHRACLASARHDEIVRWPAELDGCEAGRWRAICGEDGSAAVVSLEAGATLVLSPTRAHFAVGYNALVARAPLSQLGAHSAPGGSGEGPRVQRLPWVQLFAVERAPARWRHALWLAEQLADRLGSPPACAQLAPSCWCAPAAAMLGGGLDGPGLLGPLRALLALGGARGGASLGAVQPADGPGCAAGPRPLAPGHRGAARGAGAGGRGGAGGGDAAALCAWQLRSEVVCSELPAAMLSHSLACSELPAAMLSHSLACSELPAAMLSHSLACSELPAAMLSHSLACSELPAACAPPAAAEAGALPRGGPSPRPRLPQVRLLLRQDALLCCSPEPGSPGPGGGLTLLLADESLLRLLRLGPAQLWARTRPAGPAGPAGPASPGPERFVAGGVPGCLEAAAWPRLWPRLWEAARSAHGGAAGAEEAAPGAAPEPEPEPERVQAGAAAAEGERLWRRAAQLAAPAQPPLSPVEAVRAAHSPLRRSARACEEVAAASLPGVAELRVFADGHAVGRFADRTVLTLHCPGPGEDAAAGRELSAVLPDGSYVRARVQLPVSVEPYAALLCHFERWARADEAERVRLAEADARRSSAIEGALGGTERLLRVHQIGMRISA